MRKFFVAHCPSKLDHCPYSFPNESLGAPLVEINDEMIATDRRYIAAASVAEIDGIQPDLQSLPAAPRD